MLSARKCLVNNLANEKIAEGVGSYFWWVTKITCMHRNSFFGSRDTAGYWRELDRSRRVGLWVNISMVIVVWYVDIHSIMGGLEEAAA